MLYLAVHIFYNIVYSVQLYSETKLSTVYYCTKIPVVLQRFFFLTVYTDDIKLLHKYNVMLHLMESAQIKFA